MTPLQQAQIRAGELRKRLAVIGGMDELTDEVRSEFDSLRKEYDDLETRQAALIIAGDAPATAVGNPDRGRPGISPTGDPIQRRGNL